MLAGGGGGGGGGGANSLSAKDEVWRDGRGEKGRSDGVDRVGVPIALEGNKLCGLTLEEVGSVCGVT